MPTYKSFDLPESKIHYAPGRDFQTEHIVLDFSVDFESRSISGTCIIRLHPIRDGLKRIVLDAREMSISQVRFDGAPCKFGYDGRRLTLEVAAANGQHNVEVRYSTTPNDGVYFTGPDVQFPHKEVQAWSHGEAEASSFWFPCHDYVDDRSSSEMRVSVPKGFTVVSNGELVSVSEKDGRTTFHWREDIPHPPYLKSFVAGKLEEIRQEADGIPLSYYFPESKRADVLRYFGETPAMVKVFREITGVKYPYKKYAQTTVEDFIYGGMENFNATTLAMNYYPDAGSEEDFQTSYGTPNVNPVNLVAHELAHQWFGDYVTCADWSHASLNEGFATYMQGLYLERTKGVDEFRWDLRMRAELFFDEDRKNYRRPIVEKNYVFPDDLFDYTLYEKGEWMLHELRYLVGDSVFFAGVKDYLTRHALGNADTHDLRKSMERVSGISLEAFFEQAFFRPGFPELEVAYSWDEGSKTATMSVKQIQKLEQGTPLFDLPCDLVFYTEKGRVKKRVNLKGPEQSFSFELDAMPKVAEFDPEEWLLKRVKFTKTMDMLTNQLGMSQDASSRALAARELGALKADSAVEALKAAAEKEQFWDVRASALRALGEVGSKKALDALVAIGLPKNRKVRRGLAEALGKFKDQGARDILKEMVARDESPYVRCEAALALAKSWPEGAFADLRAAMDNPSPNSVLTEACLEAIGKLEHPDVPGIIIENLRYGRPVRARIGAMKAIKSRGRLMEGEVSALREILRGDKDFRVRQYAIASLVPEVLDRRLLGVVEEASRADRDPRVRRRALEAHYMLSSTDEADRKMAGLKDEVERLREDAARGGAAN